MDGAGWGSSPVHPSMGGWLPWGGGMFLPSQPQKDTACLQVPDQKPNRWHIHFPGVSWWIGEVFILFLMNDAQCKSGDITYVSVAAELFIGEKITRDQPKESARSN